MPRGVDEIQTSSLGGTGRDRRAVERGNGAPREPDFIIAE
jgi:hypothetical protein